jgi:hypothetical protein
MPEQQAEQSGAYEASQQAAAKKPPWEEGAGRRKILSFGEVIDRSIGAARGANGVAEGALNVRPPRLPNEKPPPARANASPAKPSASVAVRIKIKGLWRNAMGSVLTLSGPIPARPRYMGANTKSAKGVTFEERARLRGSGIWSGQNGFTGSVMDYFSTP